GIRYTPKAINSSLADGFCRPHSGRAYAGARGGIPLCGKSLPADVDSFRIFIIPCIYGRESKRNMIQFLSYLVNGISLGSVYAIIALGYSMVYGIAKMLNFAHGDVIMVGAYISFCVTQYMGLPAILSVVAAMFVCTVLGIVIERLAYKPLRSAP